MVRIGILYAVYFSVSSRVVLSNIDSSLCYASKNINPTIDGYHSYPIDLFGNNGTDNSMKGLVCSSESRSKPINICPIVPHVNCPITEDFVDIASKELSKWIRKPYLCDLKSRLFSGESINVLIMGGSVTTGAHTLGCMCDHSLEPKCSKTMLPANQCASQRRDKCCSWSWHFIRWLQSKTIGRINFMDFGIGGVTSSIGQELYADRLVWPDYVKTRVLDLVILDYGVNDACDMWDGRDIAAVSSVEHGLEKLVRKIINLYTVEGKQPKIVLINGMPSFHAGYQYTRVYSRVAEHYSLPLWSYNDVVMSDAMKNRSYSYIMRWRDTCKECGDVHPAWYVHLFMADLYSAIMEKEFARCDSTPSLPVSSTTTTLPPSLSSEEGNLYWCGNNTRSFLHVSMSDVMKMGPQIGRFLPPKDTSQWVVTEIKKGKFGWMDEFPEQEATHFERTLTFQLRDYSNEMKNNSQQGFQGDMILRVQFLRSSKYAGKFAIYLCGVQIGPIIDTCLPHFNKRQSTQEVQFALVKGFPTSCPKSDRNSKENKPIFLELKHIPVSSVTNTGGIVDKCDRGKAEKVKVIEVLLCAAATEKLTIPKYSRVLPV